MTWTTERTWTVGDIVTAAMLNANLRDNMNAIAPALVTSLPGSPTDNDRCILVDSTTNPSWQWHLRYNAGSTSPYKWESLGGSARFAGIDAEEGPASSGGWVNLATDGPSITLPSGVGGDFYAEGHATSSNSSGGIQGVYIGLAVGNATPGPQAENNAYVGGRNAMVVKGKLLAVGAAGVIKLRYQAASTTSVAFAYRYLTIWPIRVG
jgi:hypothetical protein